jgi:hypothetical protein
VIHAQADHHSRGGAEALDHAVGVAAEAGLSSLPSEAFHFDLASRSFRLVEGERLTAFLAALRRQRRQAEAAPDPRHLQRLADAAIAALRREAGTDLDRMATLVVEGAGAGLDEAWIDRVAALRPIDWRLAALYARVVGCDAVGTAEGLGAALGRETAAWAPPAELEASLRRLQRAGIIEDGTDIALSADPWLPPRRLTRAGARMLVLAAA